MENIFNFAFPLGNFLTHVQPYYHTSKEDELFRIKGVFAMDVVDVIGNAADDTTAVVILVWLPHGYLKVIWF